MGGWRGVHGIVTTGQGDGEERGGVVMRLW